MPGFTFDRKLVSNTPIYTLSGRLDAEAAWRLSARLAQEPHQRLVLDFGKLAGFVDHATAVLANAIKANPGKTFELRGLRHHQICLFRYFGVEVAGSTFRPDAAQSSPPPRAGGGSLREVV